ncbi:MAG: NAD+ synthase [Endomicrobiales bacterium]
MRIALAQINTTVGDLDANVRKMKEYADKAREGGAYLVAFPELAVTGYPPEDLLLKPGFIRDNLAHLRRLASSLEGITAVAGFVDRSGRCLYNAAAVISGGAVTDVYRKVLLPNYGVFDEKRYFKPGEKPLVIDVAGVPVGITICEDVWETEGPVRLSCAAGAKLVLVINASPYHAGKVKERELLIQKQAKQNKVFIAYVNLVGGQDELVFDGFSMVVSPQGKVMARARGFTEELLFVDLPLGKGGPKSARAPLVTPLPKLEEEVYQALVTGLSDYVKKNGFKNVVIGLSGGIDSALVAALAADALGKENVHGVFMPTRYSSGESREDARELAKNLGIAFLTIPVDEIFQVYLSVLEPLFKGRKPDITEENLQARIRGNIVMALSNKFGWLVLTTGNKSEMSTGYATLYGDMTGGFAVIKDVPKTLVYKLSLYRNSRGHVIPERTISKAPTAELRPGQKDSDSLPVYEMLDPILKGYIEEDKEARDIVAEGFPGETVHKVLTLVDRSEYKRRQSPPGIKITPRAFGRDRRMPITNRYSPDVRKEPAR